jgi:hypothetical protein
VRLVDYAHSLLWLLYQPNLDSRLNGDCPNGTSEFARLVRTSRHRTTRTARCLTVHMMITQLDPAGQTIVARR